TLSPHHPITPSPHHPITPSPHHPITLKSSIYVFHNLENCCICCCFKQWRKLREWVTFIPWDWVFCLLFCAGNGCIFN
ncbi:MAG: hypothetical protein WBA93_29750, partial [Microcoleaceae cyanobacterium]